MRYIIITPAKNEGEYIENTIKSIINQTILPQQWIIVDDGSTDNTVKIINKYLDKYKWIKLVINDTKQENRAGGGKVIKAFNKGLKHIKTETYDFITKLDADLTLSNNYFEEISNAFIKDKKLGICGGVCYIKKGNEFVKEHAYMYHVRGALKSVRRTCFKEIGGFMTELHWDGIDEFKARYYGWKVYSIDIKVIHHRPTSKAYKPIKFNFKNGYAARKRRASFFLSILRALKTAKTYPYIINSIAYIYGYILAFLKGEKNILTKEISKSMNKFHYSKLFNKKYE